VIGLVLVCWDGTRSAGPPSSHLDKRPAPVECRGMPAPEREPQEKWEERERERERRSEEKSSEQHPVAPSIRGEKVFRLTEQRGREGRSRYEPESAPRRKSSWAYFRVPPICCYRDAGVRAGARMGFSIKRVMWAAARLIFSIIRSTKLSNSSVPSRIVRTRDGYEHGKYYLGDIPRASTSPHSGDASSARYPYNLEGDIRGKERRKEMDG